jgi:hypothetical protein
MNRWRVGEDMGSKEMDICPLIFARSHPLTTTIPAAMHTPLRALPPGIPMDVDRLEPSNRSHKPATAVARLVTLERVRSPPQRPPHDT